MLCGVTVRCFFIILIDRLCSYWELTQLVGCSLRDVKSSRTSCNRGSTGCRDSRPRPAFGGAPRRWPSRPCSMDPELGSAVPRRMSFLPLGAVQLRHGGRWRRPTLPAPRSIPVLPTLPASAIHSQSFLLQGFCEWVRAISYAFSFAFARGRERFGFGSTWVSSSSSFFTPSLKTKTLRDVGRAP
jgi:hypothetical protein